jgi:hypothetical protein
MSDLLVPAIIIAGIWVAVNAVALVNVTKYGGKGLFR